MTGLSVEREMIEEVVIETENSESVRLNIDDLIRVEDYRERTSNLFVNDELVGEIEIRSLLNILQCSEECDQYFLSERIFQSQHSKQKVRK